MKPVNESEGDYLHSACQETLEREPFLEELNEHKKSHSQKGQHPVLQTNQPQVSGSTQAGQQPRK